jgi:hypothetical protein
MLRSRSVSTCMRHHETTQPTIIEQLAARNTYIGSTEAMGILGITRQTFCLWVREGRLQRCGSATRTWLILLYSPPFSAHARCHHDVHRNCDQSYPTWVAFSLALRQKTWLHWLQFSTSFTPYQPS